MVRPVELDGRPEQVSSVLDHQRWRTVFLASLGGSLEFYDFIIYGVFAQYISRQFFPSDVPYVSLILTFSVLALGYLARPIGGLIIGSIGDRHGRRGVFIGSLGLTTAATIGIGLLPGYDTIGIAAPILLVTLRLVQGFCLGGELPGALTFAVESAPRRVGLACGIIFLFVNTGVLLATFINLGIQRWLSPEDVVSYGWRIAFLVGGLVGMVNYALRRRLEESPVFLQLRGNVTRFPVRDLLSRHPREVLIGVGVVAAIGGVNGILFGYMPAYLVQTLHYGAPETALSITIGLALVSVGNIFFGWVSDFVPRHLMLRFGSGLLILCCLPFGWLLIQHTFDLTVTLVGFLLVYAVVSAIWSSVLAILFPPAVRFSGIAISYNLCVTVLSGFAPLIATTLLNRFGWVWAPIAYMAACVAITFVTTFFIKRDTVPELI